MTVWSLVMVRNQMPAQVVNLLARTLWIFGPKLQYYLNFKYMEI